MIKKDIHRDKKKIFEKAQEYERRAKNLDKLKDDFCYEDNFESTRAELYEKAGEHYLNAQKPRKAISSYESAAKSWERLVDYNAGGKGIFSTPTNSPSGIIAGQYAQKKKKDLKNAERIQKTIKGKFKGLESKSIVGIIGALGILGSISLFSGRITGNAIGNISFQGSNILGASLFLVGIAGCLFYFKNRK